MNTSKNELRAAVEKNARRKRTTIIVIALVAVVALVAGIVTIVNVLRKDDAAVAQSERLSLTLATDEDSSTNDAIAEVTAENGLDVEWVNLDDWVLPNTEVVAGSMDGNSFQHTQYLANFDAENDADLQPVFSTFVSNWGVFSATVDSLEAIPEGGTIGIPDDASNAGRALLILQTAGLITLDDTAGSMATTDDIADNPRKLEFTDIDTQSISQQYDDPSLDAVVSGVHHFDPSLNVTLDDALYVFDPMAEANVPFVNVIATRADNLDNPAWAVLEAAYDDQRVLDALAEEYAGTQTRAKVPADKLRSTLEEIKSAAESQG